MTEVITIFLMVVGAFFILVAALGAWRMPDVLLRMSATTKAATLGIGAIMLAMIFHFSGQGLISQGVTGRTIATIAFVFATAPVSAHMIGRAAYKSQTPIWSGTVLDELEGQYDAETQVLDSKPNVVVAGEPGPDLDEMHSEQYESTAESQVVGQDDKREEGVG